VSAYALTWSYSTPSAGNRIGQVPKPRTILRADLSLQASDLLDAPDTSITNIKLCETGKTIQATMNRTGRENRISASVLPPIASGEQAVLERLPHRPVHSNHRPEPPADRRGGNLSPEDQKLERLGRGAPAEGRRFRFRIEDRPVESLASGRERPGRPEPGHAVASRPKACSWPTRSPSAWCDPPLSIFRARVQEISPQGLVNRSL